MWDPSSCVYSAPLDPGDRPRDREGSFLNKIYREWTLAGFGTHLGCDQGEGRRTITRGANNSHVCYAFLVEKGKGGANVSIKFVYIWTRNNYLW